MEVVAAALLVALLQVLLTVLLKASAPRTGVPTYVVDLGVSLPHQDLRVLQHRHLLLVKPGVKPPLSVLRCALLLLQEIEPPVSLLFQGKAERRNAAAAGEFASRFMLAVRFMVRVLCFGVRFGLRLVCGSVGGLVSCSLGGPVCGLIYGLDRGLVHVAVRFMVRFTVRLMVRFVVSLRFGLRFA